MRSAVQKVKLGRRLLELSSKGPLQRLSPTVLAGADVDSLRAQLADQGYLYLPQLLPRDKVLTAHHHVLKHLHDEGVLDTTAGPWQSGVLNVNCGVHCVPFLEGRNAITHSEPVLRVLEAAELRTFFDRLFGEPCRSFDFKWLRCVPRQAFTGAHTDSVYMSRGSKRLITCWIPFHDIPMEMGSLAVLEGSHKLPSYQHLQKTYAQMDAESANLDGTGWFTEDPAELTEQFGGTWKTTDFRAGDVMIFGMWTLHMSTANQTDHVRISCDTRWQPAADPVDSRYVGELKGHGEKKFGLSKAGQVERTGVTIEQLKSQWGFKPWSG